MNVEITTLKGRELASQIKKAGIQAMGDSEGVTVTVKDKADKKKVVAILLKHGMDMVDLKDGYPELLEAEEIEEAEDVDSTDFDYTFHKDGSITLGINDTEYDIPADVFAEMVDAYIDLQDENDAEDNDIDEKKKKKAVKESVGIISFEKWLSENKPVIPKVEDNDTLDEFVD